MRIEVASARGRRQRRAVLRGAALAALLITAPGPGVADAIDDDPASFAFSPGLANATSSFERHAKMWMTTLEQNEAENRRTAPVYGVDDTAVIRFDGYDDDYETHVKPTGNPNAPYVGILRYKENLYSCLRDDKTRCTVTRSVPVSEIFSYKNGRWQY